MLWCLFDGRVVHSMKNPSTMVFQNTLSASPMNIRELMTVPYCSKLKVKHTLGNFTFLLYSTNTREYLSLQPRFSPQILISDVTVMSFTSLRSCLQILRFKNWKRNLLTNILHTIPQNEFAVAFFSRFCSMVGYWDDPPNQITSKLYQTVHSSVALAYLTFLYELDITKDLTIVIC